MRVLLLQSLRLASQATSLYTREASQRTLLAKKETARIPEEAKASTSLRVTKLFLITVYSTGLKSQGKSLKHYAITSRKRTKSMTSRYRAISFFYIFSHSYPPWQTKKDTLWRAFDKADLKCRKCRE